MLRRSVERELEIIGEAVSKIEKIDPTIEIDGKRQIIGLRNRVIHNYDAVDNEIVWGILSKHLLLLKQDSEKLLNS
jgi:uncharacterized protein with HEPN domain